MSYTKSHMSEEEAAQRFVLDTVVSASANWPSITEGWRPLLIGNVDPIDSPWALHEFVLAAVSCQMRVLRDFFVADQVHRLRDQIIAFLATPDLRVAPEESVAEYERAWKAAGEDLQLPFYRMAQVYFERVALRLPAGAVGERYRHPPLLLLVGSAVSNFGGPWWKNLTGKYKVVH